MNENQAYAVNKSDSNLMGKEQTEALILMDFI